MARAKRKSKFRGKVASNTQKQRTMGSSYGHLQLPKGVNVFKEEPGGRAYLDCIPYVVTDENHLDRDEHAGIAIPGNEETDLWYKKPYRLHRNIGPESKSIICPTTWGRKCPICEYKAARLKDGVDYDEVRDLRPSLRNLYLVVPLGMKDYKEEIHIWDISQFLFQDMLNEELDENEDYCAFPDLEEGLSLRIRFSEEKFGKNSFAKTSRIDFEERENQYDSEILDDVPCLDDVITCPSYEEVEALFFGMEDPVNEESQQDPEPEPEPEKPKTGGLRRKPKTVKKDPEPEPDPEPQVDEDNVCIACGGEGVNSKGGECKPCRGSGLKQERKRLDPPTPTRRRTPVKQEEQAPEPEKPKPTSTRKQQEREGCPYAYKFGVDTDTKEECDECEKWDDCIEAKENA